MKRIAVLMSTYNGEKYLRTQIDSILNQRGVEIDLWIRDDDSSDNTVSIIQEYQKKNKNIFLMKGNNLGYANSFLTLLHISGEYDFFSFADQDDFWHKDKLIRAVHFLDKNPNSLYASSLRIVDENLNLIKFKKYKNYNQSVGSVLSRIRLAGCTMVFGKELHKKVEPLIDDIIQFNTMNYGHDAWIMLLTLLFSGEIIVDERSYISYRRHSQTVTNINRGLRKRLLKEINIFINKNNSRVKISRFLLKYKSIFDKKQIDILKDIVNYQDYFNIRMKLIFGNEIKTNVKTIDLKNKIAVLLRRY